MQVEYPFRNYNLFVYVYVLSFFERAKKDQYFNTFLQGYRSETDIEVEMLEMLTLFIKENIVDASQFMPNQEQQPACDEELSYLIKCLKDDIPYKGFSTECSQSMKFLSAQSEFFKSFHLNGKWHLRRSIACAFWLS